jgi:hypothetical protein
MQHVPSICTYLIIVCTTQDQLKDKGDPKDIVVLSELLGRHILPLANLIGDKLRLDVHREVRPFGSVMND